MLAALFVFGSAGFWFLCGISTLILLALVEYERSGWAFLTLLATAALIFLCGNAGVVAMIVSNPLGILSFLIGYTFTGSIWSLVKWFLFVKDRKEKYLERKAELLKQALRNLESSNVENPTEKQVLDEMNVLSKQSRYDGRDLTARNFGMPVPSNHKGRIIHWMAYWPWSMLNALLFDFVRRFFQHLYNVLAGVFRKISESIYKDVLDEIGDDSRF